MTLARENGFTHWGAANLSAFQPLASVRAMCAADRCGQYGKNWACPPACGSLAQAAAAIARCRRGLLVQTTGPLAHPLDYPAMESLALTAGACTLCARCTCPTRPCRYPSKRLTSMEAYGLWVSDICQKSGLPYNYGPQTLTYTSCVLIAEE